MSQDSDNVETQVMDDQSDVHPIPRTVTPPPKPKKVLTEAQKLAFMKGREKRAANIQQRKMEKAKQEENPDVIPTTPPKTKSSSSYDMDYDLLAEKVANQLAAKQKQWLKTPPSSPPPKKRVYVRRTESSSESLPPPPPSPPPPPPPSRPAMPSLTRTVHRATSEFNWM
jgi:hypothetical protein